ncbi:MAG: hypothetical protein COU35_00990 [Candidatus Magasanikbacteria bacterium CG10_big_fil_rev_8_21_14_0_10_47_10]|uniref:histidine kinase n=1 Tax=Candidatus Magasanikbacteria bacterium CG10_big_fil_rev_8_21_14_0_10_47_10 TaxID=1974652 RepID=A0A2H0TRF5_9BACT|nr:MAG: hypothetical protein COU35_00990 [Candidatus Magasanikbacteria bacterium CG10_big_fil_rev_8_21_14_0_10_47_10]
MEKPVKKNNIGFDRKRLDKYFISGSVIILMVLITFGIAAVVFFTQQVKIYLVDQRAQRITKSVQLIASREVGFFGDRSGEESFVQRIENSVEDIQSLGGISNIVFFDDTAHVLWSKEVDHIGRVYEANEVARALSVGVYTEEIDHEEEEFSEFIEKDADRKSYDSEIYIAVPLDGGDALVVNLYLFDEAVYEEVATIRLWLIIMTIIGSFSIGSILIGFYARHRYLIRERENILYDLANSQAEKYKAVTDSSPDCIKLFDLNGKLQFISKSGIEEHFLKKDEIAAFDPLTTIVPKDQAKFKKAFEKALLGTMSAVVIRHTKKGSNREVCEERVFPIRGAKGTVEGVYAVSRDISEKLKKERQIVEMADLRNKFIRIVSHQLRTPLNSIRWNMETLLAGELGPLKSEQKEFLRVSHDAEVRVINRINDLITIMDIEEGRVTLKKESVSLPAIWNSVLSEFASRAKAKGIAISVDPASIDPPDISADTDKVRTIFTQLLRNAIDYTKEKGAITVIWKVTQAAVRFEIHDTGIGIPVSDQKNIFKKFCRASNAATILPDASGVGLAIANVYIGRHGGTIGFESQEQKGTTFWFELPLNE